MDVISSAKNRISLYQIIASFLIIISLFLILTIIFVINSVHAYPHKKFLSHDNSYVYSILKQLSTNQKMGIITIEKLSKGSMISGKINNLSPGSQHGLLILENSNFFMFKENNTTSIAPHLLTNFHFNPYGAKNHTCRDSLSLKHKIDEKYHMGDLGNLIANEKGEIEFQNELENLDVDLIYGRPLVLLNKEDDCNCENIDVENQNILAYGILSVYSQNEEQIRMLEIYEKKKVLRKERLELNEIKNFNNSLNLNQTINLTPLIEKDKMITILNVSVEENNEKKAIINQNSKINDSLNEIPKITSELKNFPAHPKKQKYKRSINDIDLQLETPTIIKKHYQSTSFPLQEKKNIIDSKLKPVSLMSAHNEEYPESNLKTHSDLQESSLSFTKPTKNYNRKYKFENSPIRLSSN